MKITLTIDSESLNDSKLWAAAEVLKRIGWTDIRKLSVSDDEAYDAQYALEKIREALAEQGYNPRWPMICEPDKDVCKCGVKVRSKKLSIKDYLRYSCYECRF